MNNFNEALKVTTSKTSKSEIVEALKIAFNTFTLLKLTKIQENKVMNDDKSEDSEDECDDVQVKESDKLFMMKLLKGKTRLYGRRL